MAKPTWIVVSTLAGAAAGAAAGYLVGGADSPSFDLTSRQAQVASALACTLVLVTVRWRAPRRFRELITCLLFVYMCGGLVVLGDFFLSLLSTALRAATGEVSVHLFGTNKSMRHLDPAELRLLLVTASGALGGMVHVLSVFIGRTGNRSFRERWAWWYLAGPPIGAVAANSLTLALGVGLVSFGTPSGDASLGGIALVTLAALIAGLFSKTVLDRLRRLLPAPQPTGGPQITGVTPETIAQGASGPQKIVISGRGFSEATGVYFEGKKVTPLQREPDKLTFDLDVASAADRPISLNVVNETRTSEPLVIERA